jgi:beta-lactamase class A
MMSRRDLLAAGGLLLPGFACAAETPFAALEKQSGARIGMAALDTGNGRRIGWRDHERFVFCSTFKLSLVAATFARADKGAEHLDEMVHYDKSAPIGVSPATRRNLDRGMTVGELCEAAAIYSDNGAANLLLVRLGGPAALTAFWRGLGDAITRLDDNEPKLNVPDGVRNTTTPIAMLGNLKSLLLGKALSSVSRARLLGLMQANTTGAAMIRAGMPPGWTVGDKTGRNPDFGLTNDIAIVTPPGRAPILITVYTARGTPEVVASAGRIVAEAFA